MRLPDAPPTGPATSTGEAKLSVCSFRFVTAHWPGPRDSEALREAPPGPTPTGGGLILGPRTLLGFRLL
jgi:hypothetical protein